MTWEFAEFGGLPVGETTRTTPSEAAATGGFFSGDLGSVYDLGWAHGPAVATGGVGGTVTAQELAQLATAFRAEHGHGWLEHWIPYRTTTPVSLNLDQLAQQYYNETLRAQLLADYEQQQALIGSQWWLNFLVSVCNGASFGLAGGASRVVHGDILSAGYGERQAGELIGVGVATVATMGLASAPAAAGAGTRAAQAVASGGRELGRTYATGWTGSWLTTRASGIVVEVTEGLSGTRYAGTVAHELTHVWQFRNLPTFMRVGYPMQGAGVLRTALGAPIRYAAEIHAYGREAWVMGSVTGVVASPLRAVSSLLPYDVWVLAGYGGAAGVGGWHLLRER